jgi:WD40 repeat protein
MNVEQVPEMSAATRKSDQRPPTHLGSDVFISYSRADREFVTALQEALATLGRSAWVDWQDIPPTAEWMAEIRSAIDQADAIVFVISPDSAASRVCGEEIEHAIGSNKRIVPVLSRETAADLLPEGIARLNWILATDGALDNAAEKIVAALDTDLERLRAHARLLVRAHEWRSTGEDPAMLLRGSDLGQAEDLVGSDAEPRPTPEQTRLVVASRRAATKRQRGAIALVTVALVVSAALGVFGWTQRGAALRQRDRAEQQTKVARSQALAGEALSAMDDQIDLAALLSIEAQDTAATSQSTAALHVVAQTTTWVEHVMHGHTKQVFAVAFDPKASVLASGSLDGTVILWNPETGKQIGVPLEGHKVVQTLAFSPDGSVLASGGDKSVILWDPQTGQRIGDPIAFDHSTYGLAFSPDGRTLAVGSADTVQLLDVASAKLIGRPFDVRSAVWDMAFAPDGRSLATSGADGTVRRWNVATSEQIGAPLKGDGSIMSEVAYSPDGGTLAAGNVDGSVGVWDPSTGKPIGKTISLRGAVTGLGYSPDGSVLATGSEAGGVRMWDAHTRIAIGGRLEGQQGPTDSLAFSPDERMLASGGDSGNVVIWGPIAVHNAGSRDSVFGVAFSPDGSMLATGNADGSINLWDPASREPVGKPLVYRGSYTNQIAFSPDGRVLAAGYGDGTVLLWDPATGERIAPPLAGHRKAEVTLAFSPDGSLLATGSWDGDVLLFDTTTWKQIGDPFTGHTGRVQRVVFSPDGSMLASSGRDGRLIVWGPTSGGGKGSVIQLPHPGDVQGLAFSPDGSTLATGFNDGSVILWDPKTGERVGEPLIGQSSQITSLAFTPDGRVLVSGSSDGNVVLWEFPNGEAIGDPVSSFGAVWGLAFSPDGRLLASGGYNGSTYVRDRSTWSSDVAFLRDRLCDVAGRNLTPAEWQKFLPSEPYAPTCPQWPVQTET